MKLKSLFAAFRIPRIPSYTEQDRVTMRKYAVMLTATGNVLLQSGHYTTEEKIKDCKSKLKHCKP